MPDHPGDQDGTVDVSIVMPCLNEAASLAHCIANADDALGRMRAAFGFSGEIVIADNGSTDGSDALATRLGARVVRVETRGYGAALIAGFGAARGRFLLMGDADGSYDFTDGVAMVGKLREGADLCMGSRFRGGIEPGAMPWKNRHIGNPVLTFVLNVLFRAGVEDAHCGLRALTKTCFERLSLRGTGMEFASEMLIKAALLHQRIAEVPATLRRDLRGRAPHLRPWRDGWRHLRYLLMLSPTWLFAVPAAACALVGIVVFAGAGVAQLTVADPERIFFGNYWVILAGMLLEIAHVSAILAGATYLYGVREGYRRPGQWMRGLARWVRLETMLLAGAGLMLVGGATLAGIAAYWSVHDFHRIVSVLPAVFGTTCFAIGVQTVLGGFLLAIIGGNEAKFLHHLSAEPIDGRRAMGASGGLSVARIDR